MAPPIVSVLLGWLLNHWAPMTKLLHQLDGREGGPRSIAPKWGDQLRPSKTWNAMEVHWGNVVDFTGDEERPSPAMYTLHIGDRIHMPRTCSRTSERHQSKRETCKTPTNPLAFFCGLFGGCGTWSNNMKKNIDGEEMAKGPTRKRIPRGLTDETKERRKLEGEDDDHDGEESRQDDNQQRKNEKEEEKTQKKRKPRKKHALVHETHAAHCFCRNQVFDDQTQMLFLPAVQNLREDNHGYVLRRYQNTRVVCQTYRLTPSSKTGV